MTRSYFLRIEVHILNQVKGLGTRNTSPRFPTSVRIFAKERQIFHRMPTISIYEEDVKAEIGEILNIYGSKQGLVKSFDELCFNFGLELDEVTSEYEMFKKERGMQFLIARSLLCTFR
jgi:hypothetical protein